MPQVKGVARDIWKWEGLCLGPWETDRRERLIHSLLTRKGRYRSGELDSEETDSKRQQDAVISPENPILSLLPPNIVCKIRAFLAQSS